MISGERGQWYAGGLEFECGGCGQCCSGPDEGFIWVTKEEIGFIAEFLRISEPEAIDKYMTKVGPRVTINEKRPSNDCIFLEKVDGQKRCKIYPVRPNQCRTWPFWNSNLASTSSWNRAAQRCAGINRGRKFSAEQIEKLRSQVQWWK